MDRGWFGDPAIKPRWDVTGCQRPGVRRVSACNCISSPQLQGKQRRGASPGSSQRCQRREAAGPQIPHGRGHHPPPTDGSTATSPRCPAAAPAEAETYHRRPVPTEQVKARPGPAGGAAASCAAAGVTARRAASCSGSLRRPARLRDSPGRRRDRRDAEAVTPASPQRPAAGGAGAWRPR